MAYEENAHLIQGQCVLLADYTSDHIFEHLTVEELRSRLHVRRITTFTKAELPHLDPAS